MDIIEFKLIKNKITISKFCIKSLLKDLKSLPDNMKIL